MSALLLSGSKQTCSGYGFALCLWDSKNTYGLLESTHAMSIVPPADELKTRLGRFREALKRRKLAAALITNERNVRYLSGFTGGDSALLVTPGEKFLLTDFRYIEEAQNS